MTDRILILDFGSQVTQLIARRVREAGVYCEIWPYFRGEPSAIREFAPAGLILSGGPASVTQAEAPNVQADLFDLSLPVLGICYGQQTMTRALGGEVTGGAEREFGRAEVTVRAASPLFEGVWQPEQQYLVWMSHGDRVTRLAPGFEVIATSRHAPFAAIADETRRLYGVQFHPEVMHTPDGIRLLSNFVHRICGCGGDWTMAAFRDHEITKIREQVGECEGHLRPVRRRRLGRRRGAGARGYRRPTDLHLCRYRSVARRRGGAGRDIVS